MMYLLIYLFQNCIRIPEVLVFKALARLTITSVYSDVRSGPRQWKSNYLYDLINI